MSSRTRIAKTLGLASVTILAASLSAAAQDVVPADQRIDLGSQQGDFFAVSQADGLHVVATFAEGSATAVPVRFETVLAPGQTVTVSSPRASGEPAASVALTRQGDQVLVRKLPVIN